MAGIREKGKIARQEWPKILARYNSGETIAQISRAYGCTAPAIRYIIKRTGSLKERAEGPPSEAAASAENEKRRVSPGRPVRVSTDRPTAKMPAGATLERERAVGIELRNRVTADVAGFLVALDYVVIDNSAEALATLQDAADRLMRSTARVRLELERLAEGGKRGASATKAIDRPPSAPGYPREH
jgi:hypothetical protein